MKVKHQPFFSWPASLNGDLARKDQNKYCSYHREKGHMTENCFSLKEHLEQFTREGNLRQFLNDDQGKSLLDGPKDPHTLRPPARVIEMILASRPGGQSKDRARSKLRKAMHLREVFHVRESLVEESPLS